MKSKTTPIILGFVTNLMFTSRIESVAEYLGFQVHWIETPGDWDEKQGDKIKIVQPVMVLIDLGISEISWGSWIRQYKSDPATRQIPLLCFGSHIDVDLIKEAKTAGADKVLARSRFFSSLPELLEKYQPPDESA